MDISKGDRSVHNDYAWTSLVRFFAKQGIKKIDEGKLSEGRKFKYKKNDWKKYNQLVKKGKSVMIQTAFGDEFAWEDGSSHGVFGTESDFSVSGISTGSSLTDSFLEEQPINDIRINMIVTNRILNPFINYSLCFASFQIKSISSRLASSNSLPLALMPSSTFLKRRTNF